MIRKTVEGREFESQMIGELHFDKEPKEGSFNPVTSDAVAKIAGGVADLDAIVPEGASEDNKLATAADVAGVQEDVDTIEGKIPSDTSTTNKLVNESVLQGAIDNASESWSTGFTPKGESSVSDLNDLTTQSNGDSYIVTDSGTLTDGSLAVVAGDQVAWDATNSVWYKLPQYATKASVDEVVSGNSARQRLQIYVTGANGYVYVEEQNVSGGKVWIKFINGRLTCRLNGSEKFVENNTDFAARIGKTLETSGKGVTDCISFTGDYALVCSMDGTFSVKGRNSIVSTDVVLFIVEYGRLTAVNASVWNDLARWVRDLPSPGIISAVHDEFYEKIISGDISEKFIFFTDPHELQGTASNWWQNMQLMFDNIKLYNDELPIDFVLCGGDLIAGGTTQDKAADMLGKSTALFDGGFKRYLPVLGNHDTNYLGTISDEDTSNGEFTQATCDALMFGGVGGKSYYKYEGNDTIFFVLDSGLCENTVTEYMKEQLEWLASELIDCKLSHTVIVIHGITNDSISVVGNDFTLIQFASDVVSMCAACNGKTTISLYGKTYDFADAGTNVEFVLSGHAHNDANKVVDGIPCIVTINYRVQDLKFDIVMPDYTARKLYLVRIDKGSAPTQSREIDLST